MAENNEQEQHHSFKKLDITLLIVVVFMVIFLMTTLGANLYFQYVNYSEGIRLAGQGDTSVMIDHAIILSYSRAWDFAVIKTSTLFLGFILVFVGALYLLRTVEIAYSLSAKSSEKIEIGLSTTSPGLVLSTLGVFIIVVLLFTKSSVNYNAPKSPSNVESEEEMVVGEPYTLHSAPYFSEK